VEVAKVMLLKIAANFVDVALRAEAFVDDAVAAKRAVEVAKVMLLKIAANFVDVALRAEAFVDDAVVAKKDVEVAWESVVFPLKVFVPVHVLKSAKSVEEAELPPEVRQVPLIAKHPPEILKPCAPVVVPTVVRLPMVEDPNRELLAKVFEDDAVVANEAVDVADPCTKRLPVVVAAPEIVRPPVAVPLPIVDDARERKPRVNTEEPENVGLPPMVPKIALLA
jgi:hypothetical protein